VSGKRVVLITGAARSGKSRHAEWRAKQIGGRLLYVATAEANDEEMAHRIKEHRRHRGKEWLTVEEPVQLTNALLNNRGRVDCAVVDCLTLWISNLLLLRDEEYAAEKVEQLIEKLPQLNFDIIFVTNEVGWAVVPDNPLARKFRDLSGTINQRVAHAADEVILMVAGIPMIVKQGGQCS